MDLTLHIGGITPFSTVDWPGKLVCVAFLAGCPWRCPYCQNHALQSRDAATADADDLFAFLESRRGLLDGVVFSGGEPLVQADVPAAAKLAKEMGFAVGLHTCGAYPARLRETLPYLDWVGLDVKAPWSSYDAITLPASAGVSDAAAADKDANGVTAADGVSSAAAATDDMDGTQGEAAAVESESEGNTAAADGVASGSAAADEVAGCTGADATGTTGELVRESLRAILDSGVDMEARTTWHPSLLTRDDIAHIGRDLAERGVKNWAVQAYRSTGTTGELPDETVYPSDMPEGIAELFETFEFRRA